MTIFFKKFSYLILVLFFLMVGFNFASAGDVVVDDTPLSASPRKKMHDDRGVVNDPAIAIAVISPAQVADMHRRLNGKADVLSDVLPGLSSALLEVKSALLGKIEDIKASNFRRATELSAAASGIDVLFSTTSMTFNNLSDRNYANANALMNVSLAIISSGALKKQLDQLITWLENADDTRDIEHSALVTASSRIGDVVAAIAEVPLR